MGHTAVAICDSCNYQAKYVVGSGKREFTTVAMFPVSRNACQELTSANLEKQPLRCERCGKADVTPFAAAGMSKGDGKRNVETWGKLTLDDGHYRCPKCGAFGLQFAKGRGMFFD